MFLYNITMNLSAQDRVKQTEKITYICMFGNIALAVLKILTAMQETWVRSLSWEEPLEKGKAAHSSILTSRIPWTV